MLGIAALAAVLAAALFFALYRSSVHTFGGNSDGATVVLEGQSLRLGHLGLHGWDLSLDSFWSVDAPVYALAVLIAGVRIQLLHAVPAFIALSTVVVGALLAARGRKGLAAAFGALTVVALLGLPSPDLAFFTLQGPWHIGTTLWCLVAFALLASGRFGIGWAVAVVFLAAGLLGDLQALALGVAPALVAGLAAIGRTRSWRAGLSSAAAAPAAVVLALAARFVLVRVGAFEIAHGVVHAHASQLPSNLGHIATWGAALLGVGAAPIGPAPVLSAEDLTNGPAVFRLLRIVGLVVVIVAVALAVADLARGTARRGDSAEQSTWRLDDLLLMGLVGDLAVFVAVAPNGNGDYARYLSAGVIFGSILAGRRVGKLLEGTSSRGLVVAAVVLVASLAAYGAEELSDLSGPAAPQSAVALGAFLTEHHLDNGVGDYWSSSIVTVTTSGRVAVRPVIPDSTGQLIRYGRQSSADWYDKPFAFLVYDTARPWRKVDATSAVASFGAPARTYAVGSYRVLVWSHPVTVSAVGYSRS